MKKYLLFLFSFLLLTGFYSYYHVSTSYAVGLNERCNGDAKTPPSKRGCSAIDGCTELACDAGLDCSVDGRCIDPNSSEKLKCKCVPPEGTHEAGKNGFQCGKDGNTAGAPIAYCTESDQGCYPFEPTVNDPVIPANSIQGPNPYQGKTITGIICQEKKAIATCKCRSTGLGEKSVFECTGTDKDGIIIDVEPKDGKPDTATGECKSDKHVCSDSPGTFVDVETAKTFTGFLEPESWKNFRGGNTGANIKGITCDEPPTICECKSPGRNGSRINGFTCKRTVNNVEIKDSDYCQRPIEACIQKDPSFVFTKKTSDGIFKEAELKGIDCVEISPMPPPAPPCAEKLDELGRCPSFDSAFGPVLTDASSFISSIFAVLLSISGGIALLLIMKAGYLLMTSAGKPDQIQGGRDQLVAAIVGLLFIIFSFVILQVIGVDILRLPGFSGDSQTQTQTQTQPQTQPKPLVTCTTAGGVCAGSGTCRVEPGYTIGGNPGCGSGTVCCLPPIEQRTCSQIGGFCAGSGTCRAEPGYTISGNASCGTGTVCCLPPQQ